MLKDILSELQLKAKITKTLSVRNLMILVCWNLHIVCLKYILLLHFISVWIHRTQFRLKLFILKNRPGVAHEYGYTVCSNQQLCKQICFFCVAKQQRHQIILCSLPIPYIFLCKTSFLLAFLEYNGTLYLVKPTQQMWPDVLFHAVRIIYRSNCYTVVLYGLCSFHV